MDPPCHDPDGIRCLLYPSVRWSYRSPAGMGRACLLATAFGLVIGGLTILVVGMTRVFVPRDLACLDLGVEELHALNPRLVPLIAHDRAGFGGAVCSCGAALLAFVWCGRPSKCLWCVLALVGAAGFGTAIGVHPAVGYNDSVHLAPAVVGAIVYVTGLLLTFRPMMDGDRNPTISFSRNIQPAGEEPGPVGRGGLVYTPRKGIGRQSAAPTRDGPLRAPRAGAKLTGG